MEQLQKTTEQSERRLTEFQSKVSQQDEHISRLEQLREQVSQQEQELGRLTEDNDVLAGQMQSMIDENKKMESELYRKANDYDTLMGRLTELQQTHVSLENELQPLREERASILRENAQLREESESLATRLHRLEATVSDQSAILSANLDTYVEMQTKLNQATEQQQDATEKSERHLTQYQNKLSQQEEQISILSTRLTKLEAEKQEALEQLQKTTEQSERRLTEFHSKVCQQDEHITRLSQYEPRMRRYREERDNLRVRCEELQKQVDNWKGLVTHSHQSQAQVAPSLNVEYDQTDDNLSSLSPTHDQPVSPLVEYQDAEALKTEQKLIHIITFAKKQQLEQAEALASLKKQISSAGSFTAEMIQLRQMNVSLTGELEDYRTQTRRLLELQPLRDERASILRENTQLREESESLAARCHRLEATVSDQSAILSANLDTYVEMQTKLNQATEQQQDVTEKSERHLTEYQNKLSQQEEQISILSTQLTKLEAEKQEALEQLQKTTEQSERHHTEFHSKVSQQDDHISRLSQYETRMRKYRDEREILRVRCKDLQKQVDNWKGLVTHSHQNQAQVAPSLNVEYDQTNDNLSSLSPTHDQPSAYTEDQHQHDRVNVKTKEGSKTAYVQKCRGGLNARSKPKVIVKRGEVFEQGTLMFVGLVNGKELAGIHMDCRVISKYISDYTH